MTDNPFDPAARRILTLKPGKERVVANRHPWIFAGAIGHERGPQDAAFAELVDAKGARLASGFHSRYSQIRLRALTFGAEELSEELLERRIGRAIARRAPLRNERTDAVRLIHADGDELSGLIVDLYRDVAVIEIANAGLESIKPLLVSVLQRELPLRGMFFKNDLPARQTERLSMEPLWAGDEDPGTEIVENGLRFRVEPASGQKTGFFLDQRDNRGLARSLSAGRRVLNLFSYSGAFGVYAAAGGASFVEHVDTSGPAMELAKKNHLINDQATPARFTMADAFSFVRNRPEPAELVIIDPPALAKSRGDVDRAARAYKDVNLFALRCVPAGGQMMTFSCSGHMSVELFQKVIFAAALDAGRRVSFVRRLTAGVDHPVSLDCPEGEYLKGFLLDVHE